MPTLEIRHPEVTVQLTGQDGNAFAIIGKVVRALKAADADDWGQYMAEATAGDYDHLLQTTMRWVNVE